MQLNLILLPKNHRKPTKKIRYYVNSIRKPFYNAIFWVSMPEKYIFRKIPTWNIAYRVAGTFPRERREWQQPATVSRATMFLIRRSLSPPSSFLRAPCIISKPSPSNSCSLMWMSSSSSSSSGRIRGIHVFRCPVRAFSLSFRIESRI